MYTLWVTGSKGQLGTELTLQHEKLKDCRFLFTDIEELDMTDRQAVQNFCEQEKPDLVINCAAYTAVDKAEDEPEKAGLLNADVPTWLSDAANSIGARLIHISTDYVFDGMAGKPYTEEVTPLPQSEYGKSKLYGEQAVMKYLDNIVIRTSWLYSAHGNNFLKTMLKLGAERDGLNVVFDQVGTPTAAIDLADALLKIAAQVLADRKAPGGIYHFTNEGVCSWYDFTRVIMNIGQFECKIQPITSDKYPTKAKRPHYSVLDKTKIKETFGLEIPHWSDGLARTYIQLSKSGS